MVTLNRRIVVTILPKRGDGIERLCESVGIVAGRDTDRTVTQVFRALIAKCNEERGIGASELSLFSGVKRVTVIHHLGRLEQAGIVMKEQHRYYLRHARMEEMVKEMQTDMLRMMGDIRRLAKEIDGNTNR
ncbi:MAG: hypothetical protein NT157_04110 [Candidatus Micrarchaeota archaeon]|nr:hypothetical protein [Candidatus Micrarchaeota archaeon]